MEIRDRRLIGFVIRVGLLVKGRSSQFFTFPRFSLSLSLWESFRFRESSIGICNTVVVRNLIFLFRVINNRRRIVKKEKLGGGRIKRIHSKRN